MKMESKRYKVCWKDEGELVCNNQFNITLTKVGLRGGGGMLLPPPWVPPPDFVLICTFKELQEMLSNYY